MESTWGRKEVTPSIKWEEEPGWQERVGQICQEHQIPPADAVRILRAYAVCGAPLWRALDAMNELRRYAGSYGSLSERAEAALVVNPDGEG